MQTQLKVNDYEFNNNYLRVSTNDGIDNTRKSFFGIGKKSFLVFHHNKYITVPTDSIAFFYIKFEASIIVTYDKREYPVNYSLEQIQDLLPVEQFFRLLVVPTIPFADKVIVSKEKARPFLDWLENR